MSRRFWTYFWRTESVEDTLNSDKGPVQDVALAAGDVVPGELSSEEGLGRHLGVISCTLLIVGRVIGTGIFMTPASILSSVGSVGASLMLWVLGFIISFCGLFIWLEFGTMYPRSGGEKVYLEAIFPKPKYLATVVFAADAILLGFTAGPCLAFANYILVSAGQPSPSDGAIRGIALGVLVFVTVLHGLTPRAGVYIMNLLTIVKIVILLFVVITGWAVLSRNKHITNPEANFTNAFANSSSSSNDYATATLKVLYAYYGWSNANYVLNNVRDPVRTLKIAGPLGLGICTVLYLFANIAYFSVVSKSDMQGTDKTTVAAIFFSNVFGSMGGSVMSAFIALSALGNAMTTAFASARVNQELAKEGIPLPFGSRFWASNWPTGKLPFPGLILQFIPSIIMIVVPDPPVAYLFASDAAEYPIQIIDLFIVIGLFWMRWKEPDIPRPFKVWWPLAAFYLVAVGFLSIAPFVPPPGGKGDAYPIPYYVYWVVGICVLLVGVIYWAVWRIVLPRMFGYELVPEKGRLEDGTVVTLFSRKKLQ